MSNDNYMMYEFKGRLMKELSRKLTKKVSINIFYKEEPNYVGVILSTPEDKEDNNRLYIVDDPWSMITNSVPLGPTVTNIVEQYKNFILLRYFKRERHEEV